MLVEPDVGVLCQCVNHLDKHGRQSRVGKQADTLREPAGIGTRAQAFDQFTDHGHTVALIIIGNQSAPELRLPVVVCPA